MSEELQDVQTTPQNTPQMCNELHNGFTAPHPVTLCDEPSEEPLPKIGHSEYHIFPIKAITVGDRFRKTLGDISALERSIQTNGLLEPIVVDRSMLLICGGRRLQACKNLGFVDIPCHFVDELDELERRELELEENFQRKALLWHEETAIVAEVHRLKQARYGAATSTQGKVSLANPNRPWSVPDTAEKFGHSPRTTNRHLSMDHAIQVIPDLTKAKTREEAERKVRTLIEDLERELVIRKRERELAEEAAKKQSVIDHNKMLLGDACEQLALLEASSVDCCIADPPYGIDMGSNKGWRAEPGFADDPVSALALIRATLKELRRVLRPNAHLYLFFPTLYYSHIMAYLTRNSYVPDDIPLVWVKDEHGTVGWDKRYAPSYEMFFFCSDGTRTLAHKRINVFTFPTDKVKENPYQKPVQLCRELLEQSTHEQEVVLDLFGGSGSTSIAAKQLGRSYIYIDNDQRNLDIAKVNLDRVQAGSHVPKQNPPLHAPGPTKPNFQKGVI